MSLILDDWKGFCVFCCVVEPCITGMEDLSPYEVAEAEFLETENAYI